MLRRMNLNPPRPPLTSAADMNELLETYRRVRPLKVIWLVMIAGLVACTILVTYGLRKGLFGVAGSVRWGAAIYPGMVLAGGLFAAPFVRRRLEKAPSFATRSEVTRRWRTGWLVGQAIKEGVGLGGLVLALLVGSPQWAFGFGVASALSMMSTPPWETQLITRLQRAQPDPEESV